MHAHLGSIRAFALSALLALFLAAPSAMAEEEGYSVDEILAEAERFFGSSTEGLAKVVEKVFADLGRPTGYVAGEEVSGAIGVGLRYGDGRLQLKSGGSRRVYWTGPSVGFDLGGNASKVFVLCYGMHRAGAIFQRFPAVDGSYYFVGGVGANYQRSGDITLAPIRLGVGLRAGASIGYMHYTPKKSWNPF
ncbi:MAG: DUF1134 domain-containing protein [Ectothiorhodospiraceae bacterium]|nr:DUF1134 domain-containing protein [Planctomycetota bacterium]MCP5151785.1 DUF1134 domain-containing protein [Chromatiales bacterium]MCP5154317.1 DUF1134 domain-containing protein [Ectothiorhodospiraceae bacterium]